MDSPETCLGRGKCVFHNWIRKAAICNNSYRSHVTQSRVNTGKTLLLHILLITQREPPRGVAINQIFVVTILTLKIMSRFCTLFNFKGLAVAALITLSSVGLEVNAQSVAREWNDVLLEAIRDDFARPTIHARNLFHTSAVMYDAWAVYDDNARPYFLNGMLGDYEVEFNGVLATDDPDAEAEAAISYAAYTLLSHRFSTSPGAAASQFRFNLLMGQLGYDIEYTSTDYMNEGGAALGNYIGQQMIEFGFQDGSNESNDFVNQVYEPINIDLIMDHYGNPNFIHPNRWQPLYVTQFIDQSGNPVGSTPEFLGPEWGEVVPFSMTADDVTLKYRDGIEWKTWMDAGDPPYLDLDNASDIESLWKWGYALVAVWSGQLDPDDPTMVNISPNSLGNISSFPEDFTTYDEFYNFAQGGDMGEGWDENPFTSMPYEDQWVKRGDYGRILAEFWADGPDSETPPGHWFTLINYVHDHPEANLAWMGEGDALGDLEWDIRSYLILGGAMHDCAIAAWSNKGYYDYPRPVSALRWMAENGQSTDSDADNYHAHGIPLVPGSIESIEAGDALEGTNGENIGKIKFKAWRGPDYITNPNEDVAGVGWVLGEYWWPYQRPTFVTPPFAGYMSGHSTFSRAAAEVVTLITGDEFWPGGMGTFTCPQEDFLVFENGPSEDVILQWATYRDASDQCSLSRIWGGIHPPADDIPGRLIGQVLGPQSFEYGNACMTADPPRVESVTPSVMVISDSDVEGGFTLTIAFDEAMDESSTPVVTWPMSDPSMSSMTASTTTWSDAMTAVLTFDLTDENEIMDGIYLSISGAMDLDGISQEVYLGADVFQIETQNPMVTSDFVSDSNIADATLGPVNLVLNFDEAMDMDSTPMVTFPVENPGATLTASGGAWSDDMTYVADLTVTDGNEELCDVDFEVAGATDVYGNEQMIHNSADALCIDNLNPNLFLLNASNYVLTPADNGAGNFTLLAIFDEDMDMDADPSFSFPVEDPSAELSYDGGTWLNSTTFSATFTVSISDTEDVIILDIDVEITGAQDDAGNAAADAIVADHFDINFSFVGVEEHDLGLLNAYPNPVVSGDDFVVTMNNVPETFELQVYNMSGQVVFFEKMTRSSNSQIRLSSEGMAAGMYFIHIHSDYGQSVFKLDVVK